MKPVADIVSLSALFIPLAACIWLQDWWLLGGLLLANAGAAGIKQLMGGRGVWGRPAGAHGCGALCDGGEASGKPGFPSGHMTTVTMFATVMYYRIPDVWPVWSIAWLFAVAWSRWAKRCHSVLQIVGGAVFGAGCGVLLVKILGPK
jgi:membrane-associated phospholipid phosphatase